MRFELTRVRAGWCEPPRTSKLQVEQHARLETELARTLAGLPPLGAATFNVGSHTRATAARAVAAIPNAQVV